MNRIVFVWALLTSGCAHLEWNCPEAPVFHLTPTSSSLRCPSTDHSVTVQHPARPKDKTDAPYIPTR